MSLFTLLLALFTSTLGIGIIVPILPLYGQSMHASGMWIGLIFSGFAIAQSIVLPFAGTLSDRVGRKGLIATGLFLYAVVSLGLITANTPASLTLVRFGQGVAAAMIVPIAQAYMGDISPKDQEGKYMGIFSVALFLGFGLGPLMGGILKDVCSVDAAVYTLSALNFTAFLTVLFFLPPLRGGRDRSLPQGRSFFGALTSKVVRGLIAFRFTAAMCRGGIIAFVPILASNYLQLSGTQIGVIVSSNILLTCVLMMPFGILADRVNRRSLVVAGGILMPALVVFLPFVHSFLALLSLSLVYGALGALVLPAASAIMVDQGKRYGMGTAMSLFNMGMTVGIAIGPPVAGLVMDAYDLTTAFFFFGLIGVLGVASFALSRE